MQAAIARGTGTRLYDNIGPYNSFTRVQCRLRRRSITHHQEQEFLKQQTSVSPLYNNGDSGMIPGFWAHASPQLLLQRLAQTGYLYGTPAANGCPDIGFLFDCDLRSSAKGNLLLMLKRVQRADQPNRGYLRLCCFRPADHPLRR